MFKGSVNSVGNMLGYVWFLSLLILFALAVVSCCLVVWVVF